MSDLKRILIVDDDISLGKMVKLNLEQTGRYQARVENWAEDALMAAREFKPHLVLLDLIMPRMPGGNVAAAFKADPAVKDTAIVFFSAAVRRVRVAEQGGKIGGYPCIPKPATVDEIVRCIETFLPK